MVDILLVSKCNLQEADTARCVDGLRNVTTSFAPESSLRIAALSASLAACSRLAATVQDADNTRLGPVTEPVEQTGTTKQMAQASQPTRVVSYYGHAG